MMNYLPTTTSLSSSSSSLLMLLFSSPSDESLLLVCCPALSYVYNAQRQNNIAFVPVFSA